MPPRRTEGRSSCLHCNASQYFRVVTKCKLLHGLKLRVNKKSNVTTSVPMSYWKLCHMRAYSTVRSTRPHTWMRVRTHTYEHYSSGVAPLTVELSLRNQSNDELFIALSCLRFLMPIPSRGRLPYTCVSSSQLKFITIRILEIRACIMMFDGRSRLKRSIITMETFT